MPWRPQIKTAVPKRRFKYGEFTAILLDEIETDDEVTYHHIMAVVKDGSRTPDVYIIDQTSPQQAHQILVVSASGRYPVMSSEQPPTLEAFCQIALEGMSQMFELSDETPTPLS